MNVPRYSRPPASTPKEGFQSQTGPDESDYRYGWHANVVSPAAALLRSVGAISPHFVSPRCGCLKIPSPIYTHTFRFWPGSSGIKQDVADVSAGIDIEDLPAVLFLKEPFHRTIESAKQ